MLFQQLKFHEKKLVFSDVIVSLSFFFVFLYALFGGFLGPYHTTNRYLYASFLLLCVSLALSRKKITSSVILLFPYIVFLVLSLTSLIYAYDASYVLVEFKWGLSSLFVMLSVCFFASDYKKLNGLIGVFIAACLVYAIWLIVQADFNLNRVRFMEKSYNAIAVEMFLALILTIIYSVVRSWTLSTCFSASVFFVVLLATGSVKIFLAIAFFFAFVFVFYFVLRSGSMSLSIRTKKIFTFFILISVLLTSLYGVKVTGLLDRPLERMLNTTVYLLTKNESFKDGAAGSATNNMRESLIYDGVRFWLDHPVFGAGLNNYRYLSDQLLSGSGTYSHNTPIEILVGLGLIGITVYYSFIVIIAIYLVRFFLLRPCFLSVCVLGCFFAFLIISMGQKMYSDIYFNFFVAVAISLIRIEYRCVNPKCLTYNNAEG